MKVNGAGYGLAGEPDGAADPVGVMIWKRSGQWDHGHREHGIEDLVEMGRHEFLDGRCSYGLHVWFKV
jgi:hypothetical protein